MSWKERGGIPKGVEHKDIYEDVGRVSQHEVMKLSPESKQGEARSSKEKEGNCQSPGRTELGEKGATDGTHGLGGMVQGK